MYLQRQVCKHIFSANYFCYTKMDLFLKYINYLGTFQLSIFGANVQLKNKIRLYIIYLFIPFNSVGTSRTLLNVIDK